MAKRKDMTKWKREYLRQKELERTLRKHALDILYSKNFLTTHGCIQHGNVTVNQHCISVAKYSLRLSRKLNLRVNERALVRGALLHDYFLYDWHDKEHIGLQNLHGFYHPGVALKNAMRDFPLSEIEKDIIEKHMWPLTMKAPKCKEAWIVSLADKWCSTMETLHLHKGHGKKTVLLNRM